MGKFFEYPTPSGLTAGDEKIVLEKGGVTYSPDISYISIRSLGDVDDTGLDDGDALIWSNANQKFEATTLATGNPFDQDLNTTDTPTFTGIVSLDDVNISAGSEYLIDGVPLTGAAVVLSDNAVTNGDDSTAYPDGMSVGYCLGQGFPLTDKGTILTHKVNANYMVQQWSTVDSDSVYFRKWDLSVSNINPIEEFNTGVLNLAKWSVWVNGAVPPDLSSNSYMDQGGDWVYSKWELSQGGADWIIEIDAAKAHTDVNDPIIRIANGAPQGSSNKLQVRIRNTSIYYDDGGSSGSIVPNNWINSTGTLRFEANFTTGAVDLYWYNALGGEAGAGTKSQLIHSYTFFDISLDDWGVQFTAGATYPIRAYEIRVLQGSVINLATSAAWNAWQELTESGGGGTSRYIENYIATDAQTEFSIPVGSAPTSTDSIDVWINGLKMVREQEYTLTTGDTIVDISNPVLALNDDVEIIIWE